MGFDFVMDKMLHHCPFQYCIALFNTTPQIFFYCTSKLVKWTCYTFSEPSFKTLPRQCSDPSVINKVSWDSILAWMKCSTPALFKSFLPFFIQPPQIFFFLLQIWSSRHVIQFLNLVSKPSPCQCSDPSVINKVNWDSILA